MTSEVRFLGAVSPSRHRRASFPTLPLLALIAALGGCSSLPSSGPTSHQVVRRAHDSKAELQFKIVDLDPHQIDVLNRAQTARAAAVATIGSLDEPPRPTSLGPGDQLTINIYEVGVSLFGSRSAVAGGATFDPSAHAEKFPTITVDEQGFIRLPYVGKVKVGGKTPSEVEDLIDRGLGGKSQSPAALVTVETNVTNTVYVSGDVNKPGRLELSYAHEHLLDAIAASNGAAQTAEDTLIRFERQGRVIEQRMGAIRPGSSDDIVLSAGDRIELIKRPRSFTVFGAAGKVQQVSFETGAVTLAEALARVGGPSDNTADPTAIFIFRYDDAIDQPRGEKPTIYRMNMLDPAAYFLTQRFAMQDKDVIYVANAAANQPSKLIGVINQLFGPVVTARALSQ